MSERRVFEQIDFGVLNDLLVQEDIRDINCMNGSEIWVTSNQRGHYRLPGRTIEDAEIRRIANQVANKMEKEFNPGHPCLEGDIHQEQMDLRVSAIHEELSVNGISLALRKVSRASVLNEDYLVESGFITRPALRFLIRCIRYRCNILFVGETGSGKTEFLKYLATFIPADQRIVTIEDSLEFNIKQLCPQASCTAFRVRPGFDYSAIIAMALRQNVNWILLQEARGREVDDLLDAMSTGHTVLTTMHTRGADTVTTRIKQMLKNEAESMSSLEMRVYSLVDLVVHLKKETGMEGVRRWADEIIEYLYDPQSRQCAQKVLYRSRTGRLNRCSTELQRRLEMTQKEKAE
mgnify:FL=1